MLLSDMKMFRVIKSDLAVLEDELLAASESPVPLITEVGAHLVRSGGKRLRPALFLLAARANGAANFDRGKAMPLAVAIEMIHMASLVHDDVIDRAGTRRGALTANAKWGNRVAILSGDYLFAQAFSLTVGRGYDEGVGLRLAELVSGLTVGEIMQDVSLYSADNTLPEYFQRIEKKTANFLALCCEIGGMVSGLDAGAAKGLYSYGHSIGMAFQMTDDLLDITGDAVKLGKPAGNDIRQGVVTLPVIRALKSSDSRDELRSIVTNGSMTDDMLSRALEIVRSSDGVQFTRKFVDEYLEKAKKSLPENIAGDVRATFIKAADYIGKRDF